MALIVLLFASCEEYYNPDLEIVPGLLVVESHVTSDIRQNFVKLSASRDFYSVTEPDKIIGAKVDLVEFGGQTIKGTESASGYFMFSKTPVPGKKYILRITYKNDLYESEQVIMPPIPYIDTLYTKHKVEMVYRTDAYGVPSQVESISREILIDAPISNQLEYYRFSYRAILQWIYEPPAGDGPPPPMWYGWKSLYDKGNFNIAGPKEFSVSDEVRNHPILSLSYNGNQYLDSAALNPSGWILIIDQYGITKESYDFHEKLNKQFAAEGSLFDPVLTQVFGNMTCKTDPSKIVLGFFDLNSTRQYRYFMNLGQGKDEQVKQRRLNRYPDIPDSGALIGETPEFWEN